MASITIQERREAIRKRAADRKQGLKRSQGLIIVSVKRGADGQMRHGTIKSTSTIEELLGHLSLNVLDHHLRYNNQVSGVILTEISSVYILLESVSPGPPALSDPG